MYSGIEIKESQSPRKIFYWNGIVDPRGLSAHYEDILSKLVNGHYQGLDLEKLRGHNVFSVRVNQSDRLLFTTITVNGKAYLMLLDEVLNHDYAKSRFLKPAVLKHYLELHGQVISDELVNAHFEELSELKTNLPVPVEPDQLIQYSRIDFYNQKFIELDDNQLAAATKASLPLIISGAPGSGKSCIALLILAQYVESVQEPIEYPVLYVTESEILASSMKRAWLALPVAQGLADNAVQIQGYQQLLKELAPQTANMTFVDKEHCKAWIASRIKQSAANQRKSKNPLSKAFFADLDGLYQELRIISACTEAEYLALGQRQSLYQNKAEKYWLFSAFKAYQTELEKSKCIHAPFYQLDLQNHYKRIVVDEAQDFSHLQLKILSMLACNRQICFCEDNRQSLSDNKSKIPFLKALMHSWGVTDNYINLQASYRCPAAVIRIANAVSGLKSLATGEGQPEIVTGREASEGQVSWFDTINDIQQAALQQAALSPDFAIVTLEHYKEEARKRFNTVLVFTVEECKGLEYKHVLAWRLLDMPLFKQADKVIGEKGQQGFKNNVNRAKQNQGREHFGPGFSALYTAFTRATDSLTIYQEKRHDLENICKVLLKEIAADQASLPSSNIVPSIELDAQWYQQARVQIIQGNVEVARAIYLDKLHKTPAEFAEFKELYTESVPTVAKTAQLVDTSVSDHPLPGRPVKKGTAVSSSKPVEPYKAKIYAYLNNLLQNACLENITKLLAHKKAKEFLFDYPLDDGACLFTRLFYEESSRNHLIFSLVGYADVWAKNMTADALCRARPATAGKYENTSPLYWLSETSKGQLMLKLLLINNPGISASISAKALCLARPLSAEHNANTSPLYWLSSAAESQFILRALFTSNPKLFRTVSIDAFCLSRGSIAGQEENTSPLYWLAASPEGREFLQLLVARNPGFIKSVSAEALCLLRTGMAGELAVNTSPLYFLCATSEGREMLKNMLTRNSKLAKSLSGASLYATRTASVKNYGNTSAFSWLAGASAGREILQILFDRNPGLIQSMSVESLCLRTDGDLSNLFLLSASLEGRQILKTVLTHNLKLLRPLLIESLCATFSEDACGVINSSVLYNLACSEEGREILVSMFSNNPELAYHVTAEALCLVGIDESTSPLYWLAIRTEGVSLLKILFTANPLLTKSIGADALCFRNGLRAAPLYWLSATPEGREVLKIIFTCNPELAKTVSIPALCNQFGPAEMSALEWFESTPDGKEILDILLAHNQELTTLNKADDLMRAVPSQGGFFSRAPIISFEDEATMSRKIEP